MYINKKKGGWKMVTDNEERVISYSAIANHLE